MVDAPNKFTLPYPPSVNNLYASVHGRKVLSREGRRYKLAASMAARVARIPCLECAVSVTARAYRPRRAGDLDNCMKAAFDSITGVGWVDDKQVEEIHAYRFDDKHNPRVEIEIGKPGTHAAAMDLLYRLARHVRGTDGEMHPATWGRIAGDMLIELQALDPERYERDVKEPRAAAV